MGTHRPERPSRETVMAAAQWAAMLDDGGGDEAQRRDCEAWCAEHPTHRLALERIRGLEARFERLDPVERESLARAASARGLAGRRLAGGLLALLLIVGTGWFAAQSFLVQHYFPDYRTAPGLQQVANLPDGSRLTIDTASAVTVSLSRAERRIRLFDGQILATVARDKARPFLVETRDGIATALGTAFIVRQEAQRTIVSVVESTVRLCPGGTRDAMDCLRLTAGESAGVAAGRITRLPGIDPHQATAWTRGWLEVDDRPLVEVLGELNRYRTRPIRFDPAALAAIHVTGSYPLKDAPRALDALAHAAGIAVRRTSDGDLAVTPRP